MITQQHLNQLVTAMRLIWVWTKSLRGVAASIAVTLSLLVLFITGMTLLLVQGQTDPFVQSGMSELSLVADPDDIGLRVVVNSIAPDRQSALLGEYITYTIILENKSGATAIISEVIAILPRDSLASSSIRCNHCIQVITTTVPIPATPEAIKTPVPNESQAVTSTLELHWTTFNSLEVGATVLLTFTGQVVNQSDGAVLKNRTIVSYREQDQTDLKQMAEDTLVVVRVKSGLGLLEQPPIWRSVIPASIYGTDWGDFDRDGDLDLVLASNIGIYIYTNENGDLVEYWHDDIGAYAARWGNFISPTRDLEIFVIALNTNQNYLYQHLPLSRQFNAQLTSINQMLSQIEPLTFDKSGNVHLIGSQSNLGILQLNNNGQGIFNSVAVTAAAGGIWPVNPGDFNNDNYPDIALDVSFSSNEGSQIGLFTYNSSSSTFVDLLSIPTFSESDNNIWPYDLAWGDFAGADGYLDLAALFPNQQQAHIYVNTLGHFSASDRITLNLENSWPRGLDAGDFNHDGLLDLVVGDSPVKVFLNTGGTPAFTQTLAVIPTFVGTLTQTRNVRFIDVDNNGSLDLFVSSINGESVIFGNFATPFHRTLDFAENQPTPATTVAWGDANGDGYLDLLLGAGSAGIGLATAFDTKLYFNLTGALVVSDDPLNAPLRGSGLGPQKIAWGDYDRDDRLEVAVGSANHPLRIYKDLSRTLDEIPLLTELIGQEYQQLTDVTALAWGDINGDGNLELAVGLKNGTGLLLKNTSQMLSTTPLTFTRGVAPISSMAWGDFDGDYHMDLAVGRKQAPVQLFHNRGDNTFSLTEPVSFISNTTSVAWVDYDQDGDIDLAIGNYDGDNLIYRNDGGQFIHTVNIASQPHKTTSMDWGDIDGDGDMDLAVGNDGEADQIFVNVRGTFVELWSSMEEYHTTGVAFGDMDNDGDLDLAISQDGNGRNGVYENFYVSPSHLTENFVRTMPLANQPSYLSIERPGDTDKAYYLSSPQILSGRQQSTVTIQYQQFDPDGSRNLQQQGIYGDSIFTSTFEYSLDGGGTWHIAKPAGNQAVELHTTRQGESAKFLWNAVADQAISDNARFRITTIHNNPHGPVQRASTSVMSPPFRVRGTTCYWPIDPLIKVTPTNSISSSLEDVVFAGAVAEGSGVIQFVWNVSNSKGELIAREARGQRIRFSSLGESPNEPIPLQGGETYTVTLRVTGELCPVTRPVTTTYPIYGTTLQLFLPLVAVNGSATRAQLVSDPTPASHLADLPTLLTLSQVTGVSGAQQPETGVVTLHWDPYGEPQRIQGYHIYREQRDQPTVSAELVATLGRDATTFVDLVNHCNSIYYITAYDLQGESLPSTSSYYTLPCQ